MTIRVRLTATTTGGYTMQPITDDMMDTRNDITPIPRSRITLMQTYRQNLLTQNRNNQSTQVINLFQQYGY